MQKHTLVITLTGDSLDFDGPDFLIDEVGQHLEHLVVRDIESGLSEGEAFVLGEAAIRAGDFRLIVEVMGVEDGQGTVSLHDPSPNPMLLARALLVLAEMDERGLR